jgi:Zn-dependent metalloprotease
VHRHALRSSTGQTSAEYMGVLLLVAVVIGSLFGSDLSDRVVTETQRAICRIASGGEPCDASARPQEESEQANTAGEPDREVHDAECDNDLPGILVRDEGDDPSGDPEADAVYDNLGQVYDYYAKTFGRDSYDDDGAQLLASINFCEDPGKATHNAFWDGTQMKFGDGYGSSLDVTAHELTHAVTSETADLEYNCQSGALNESMSDIFASNVDADDWEIGEDLPGGALRDMANPENGHPPQPGHTDDFVEMPNDGSPFNDSGGVHHNSGIPNRAYYLMVQSIGRNAAEEVVYRALTEKLESDSGFEDFRTASLEVAKEQFGEDSPEYRGVNSSFAAVGLDGTWVAPEVEGC